MVIAYGMCARGPSLLLPGVNGATVESLQHSHVFCLYSQLERMSSEAAGIEHEALAFNRVVQAVFASTTILPFRYPTVLSSAEELRTFLRAHAEGFRSELQRLRGAAELKIRLTPSSGVGATASGTEYLRARARAAAAQKDLAESVKAKLGASLRDWRDLSGGERVVFAALVLQDEAAALKRSIQTAYATSADCTGPWPPSDFVTYNPHFPA